MESLAYRLGILGIGGRGLYSSPGSKPLHHSSDEESDNEHEESPADVIVEQKPVKEIRKITENSTESYSKLKNNQNGGYKDSLQEEKSEGSKQYGGRGQDGFSGFGNNEGFQSKPQKKNSEDWGDNWGDDSGWDESPKKENEKKAKNSKASAVDKKKSNGGQKSEGEGLLIDFGEEKAKDKKDDSWNDDGWEDDAWESLESK